MNRDIYEAITGRFVEHLKRRTVPWQKPWFAARNIVSRKPYRGINAPLLGSTEYQSSFCIRFRQALGLGGHVEKGEKFTPVTYVLQNPRKAGRSRKDHAARGKPARIPFVRWVNVFNLDQTEGIPAPASTANQGMLPPTPKGGCNRGKCPTLSDPTRGIRRVLLADTATGTAMAFRPLMEWKHGTRPTDRLSGHTCA